MKPQVGPLTTLAGGTAKTLIVSVQAIAFSLVYLPTSGPGPHLYGAWLARAIFSCAANLRLGHSHRMIHKWGRAHGK